MFLADRVHFWGQIYRKKDNTDVYQCIKKAVIGLPNRRGSAIECHDCNVPCSMSMSNTIIQFYSFYSNLSWFF